VLLSAVTKADNHANRFGLHFNFLLLQLWDALNGRLTKTDDFFP
jgi:hypothetical protein